MFRVLVLYSSETKLSPDPWLTRLAPSHSGGEVDTHRKQTTNEKRTRMWGQPKLT